MECTQCGGKVVPAGISKKTGKPYQAFCSVCHAKQAGLPVIQTQTNQVKAKSEPDWDAIAIGKTASLFIAAQLQAGKLIEEIDVQATIKLANEVVEGSR